MAEPEETQRVLFESPETAVQCLRRWQERLGHRFCPVLLRENPLPYELQGETDHDAVIRGYFELCTLRGTAPRGAVSPLAEDVLTMTEERMAALALRQSGKSVPWQVVNFSIDGRILS